MRDKRTSKRRSVRYSAWLTLADGALAECVLSDISETGARVVLQSAAAVPDVFILMLSANGSARRACRVVWRNPQQIGVKFDKNADPAMPARPVPTAETGAAPAAAESEPIERVDLPA
jgi:hypothetical protein